VVAQLVGSPAVLSSTELVSLWIELFAMLCLQAYTGRKKCYIREMFNLIVYLYMAVKISLILHILSTVKPRFVVFVESPEKWRWLRENHRSWDGS
jgi:hypothetical protein